MLGLVEVEAGVLWVALVAQLVLLRDRQHWELQLHGCHLGLQCGGAKIAQLTYLVVATFGEPLIESLPERVHPEPDQVGALLSSVVLFVLIRLVEAESLRQIVPLLLEEGILVVNKVSITFHYILFVLA